MYKTAIFYWFYHCLLLYNNMYECMSHFPNEPNFYLRLFATILLLLPDNGRETDIQYIFRKKEKGRQCSHPLSLHPGSLFPSVIVIFERLDWRQWQKREGELKVGDVLPLMCSLCILPPHLPHSPSPLLPALKSCSSTLQLPVTLGFSLYFWSLSFICL